VPVKRKWKFLEKAEHGEGCFKDTIATEVDLTESKKKGERSNDCYPFLFFLKYAMMMKLKHI
jgi:hypothetical protein